MPSVRAALAVLLLASAPAVRAQDQSNVAELAQLLALEDRR